MEKIFINWMWSFFLKLVSAFRRFPPSKRNLIISGVCVFYLIVVVSQVGHSWSRQDRRNGRDKHRGNLGLFNRGTSRQTDTSHSATGGNTVVPTRSNVVYITLKSKRLKPAIIRGTVRPKLRRKVRRNQPDNVGFEPNKPGTFEDTGGGAQKRTLGSENAWKEIGRIDYGSLDRINTPRKHVHSSQTLVSSIRIYSEKAPPWFSTEDVHAMRVLADAKVSGIREFTYRGSASLLVFESETNTLVSDQQHTTRHRGALCRGRCGIIRSPADTSEVFGFHLDRVLGLNRTLPAVSRRFSRLHDGQPCPVVSLDTSLYPEGLAAGQPTVKLTWGEYQSSLEQQCWHKNVAPQPDSGCTSIHHYEWSGLALFDFLMQIHSRLDQSCCGFRPRLEDPCSGAGSRTRCEHPERVALANILHRGRDPRRLVFTHNKGFFDRNEDNLDFRLLQGIEEFPAQALGVLRSSRLREKLLQSLFLDQTYWESQGGRGGIDKLIDIIERRAKVLLTYINARGIGVFKAPLS